MADCATPRGHSSPMTSKPVTRIPVTSAPVSSNPVTRVIDCAECTMFESEHCADCVVTHLCDQDRTAQQPSTAVVFDLAELRAVKLLADAGLVPTLRHSASG